MDGAPCDYPLEDEATYATLMRQLADFEARAEQSFIEIALASAPAEKGVYATGILSLACVLAAERFAAEARARGYHASAGEVQVPSSRRGQVAQRTHYTVHVSRIIKHIYYICPAMTCLVLLIIVSSTLC